MKKSMKLCIAAFLVAASAFAFASCGSQSQDTPRSLVLYYSQSGGTFAVATEFQRVLGADIARIEAVNPYDGTYQETVERCQREKEEGIMPEIEPLDVNLDDYDIIFLGYPVWYGSFALPIGGLLESYDLSGKKIVPFCTFGTGGMESSVADLKAALPGTEIFDGYGLRSTRIAAASAEVEYFLKIFGYIESDVEELSDYSDQRPVTEEEKTIFDAACGNHWFHLGTPETVAVRSTPFGTDYKFIVRGQNQDAENSTSTIYVTLSAAEGATPEFMKAVR